MLLYVFLILTIDGSPGRMVTVEDWRWVRIPARMDILSHQFFIRNCIVFLIKYQQKRKDRPGWQFLNNITFLVLKICTNGTNCFWMAEYCKFFMRQSVTDVRHDILYFIPFSGEFRSSLIETLIHQMPFECCNQCMFPTFN